ncbi:MAG: hypothetical protein EAX95_08330 [Candidatus Thorarchaeota archaeon]|nr:hypothetical protein [Candidatus Thorarchaeota archaeon]
MHLVSRAFLRVLLMKRRIERQPLALTLVVFLVAHCVVASGTTVANCYETAPVLASLLQGSEDYIHHPPIIILHPSDFTTLGFDGSGSPEDPFVIEGLNVTAELCLHLQDIASYVIIRNCFFKCTVNYLTCAAIDNSNHTTIQNCIFQGGNVGIQVMNSFFITIEGCVLFEATTGIHCGSSAMLNCSGCRILNNEVGIFLLQSEMCNLTSNKVYRNSLLGIRLGLNATGNIVTQNMVGRNRVLVVETNAEDIGTRNIWTGNYWSDYVPPGPYEISGASESRDDSPRQLLDGQDPDVEPAEDLFYVEGSTGYEIQWNATDEYPWSYVITKGAEVKEEGTWISRTISFSVDGLPPGEHRFNIKLIDLDGRESLDSVVVFVFIIVFSNIGTTELVIGSASSIALVLGLILLFKIRQRRASVY